jgi:quercetin dioxygenase-like cupin family protein
MTVETMKSTKKNFSAPDELMDCGHGTMALASLEDATLARVTLQPGWKWSEHVRPMAKTEYCEIPHHQYVISGRLLIAMEDGTKMELVPGDFAVIAPGHDAWVLGDEPFIAIDFSPAMKNYAREGRECQTN